MTPNLIIILSTVFIVLSTALITIERVRAKKYKRDKALLDRYLSRVINATTIEELQELYASIFEATTQENFGHHFFTVHSVCIQDVKNILLRIDVMIETIKKQNK